MEKSECGQSAERDQAKRRDRKGKGKDSWPQYTPCTVIPDRHTCHYQALRGPRPTGTEGIFGARVVIYESFRNQIDALRTQGADYQGSFSMVRACHGNRGLLALSLIRFPISNPSRYRHQYGIAPLRRIYVLMTERFTN
jgi:hypothetical protein